MEYVPVPRRVDTSPESMLMGVRDLDEIKAHFEMHSVSDAPSFESPS
jgi:hypothetical protein